MAKDAVIFIVSDTDNKNFPVDKNDLKNRLAKIAEGLPAQGANIEPFVIPAFELFRDCGMITKKYIDILQNQNLRWLDSDDAVLMNTKMNPLGGVLREKGLTMCDKSNLRYYCPADELTVASDIELWDRLVNEGKNFGGKSKLVVICENTTYYISNDWFAPEKSYPTKQAFFSWLMFEVIGICNKKWAEDELEEKDFDEPVAKKVPSENNSEIEKLLSNLTTLVARIDSRVDNLEKVMQKIAQDIPEIKIALK